MTEFRSLLNPPSVESSHSYNFDSHKILAINTGDAVINYRMLNNETINTVHWYKLLGGANNLRITHYIKY